MFVLLAVGVQLLVASCEGVASGVTKGLGLLRACLFCYLALYSSYGAVRSCVGRSGLASFCKVGGASRVER